MTRQIENKVVKRVMRWPFMSDAGGIRANAAPGLETFGSGPALVSPAVPINPADPNASSLFQAVQRLIIPDRHGLRGISIAPDSAIAECDIYVSGRSGDIDRVRISPGNPMLGDLGRETNGAEWFDVALPVPYPAIQVGPTGTGKIAVWDASVSTTSTNLVFAASPLRLEMWYGDILPMRSHSRSPLKAFWKAEYSVGVTDTLEMWVCTSGRRRLYLDVVAASASLTVSVDGIVMAKSEVATFTDIANFAPILTNVAQTNGAGKRNVVWDNASFFDMIRIKMTDTTPANSPIHSFWLHGYDY